MRAPIHWIPIQNHRRSAQNRVLIQWLVWNPANAINLVFIVRRFLMKCSVFMFCFVSFRSPTMRLCIYRVKSVKMWKMMWLTFARTMGLSEEHLPLLITGWISGLIQQTINKKIQWLWLTFRWVLYRVSKKLAVLVRVVKIPMESIYFAKICETYDSPTNKRIIHDEPFSKNCKCTHSHCHTANDYLHSPTRKHSQKMDGMSMNRLLNSGELYGFQWTRLRTYKRNNSHFFRKCFFRVLTTIHGKSHESTTNMKYVIAIQLFGLFRQQYRMSWWSKPVCFDPRIDYQFWAGFIQNHLPQSHDVLSHWWVSVENAVLKTNNI